eukprot:jgi/Psemu1/33072/gm1.33072_g
MIGCPFSTDDGGRNPLATVNPFLYHFETGFDVLCTQHGHLALTILEGCKQINNGQFDKDEALEIWEECFKYVTEELFLDYEEGDTGGIDHVWAMEDIKCYNNMGIGPEQLRVATTQVGASIGPSNSSPSLCTSPPLLFHAHAHTLCPRPPIATADPPPVPTVVAPLIPPSSTQSPLPTAASLRESTLLQFYYNCSSHALPIQHTVFLFPPASSLSPTQRLCLLKPLNMPTPTTPTKLTVGRSSASPKKRLQSTPSLSSSSARSSGSRYPKRALLKKSFPSPTPVPTQATPSPSSLHPRNDAPLSASSSSASQSSVTSMSVSSLDSSVASSTRSAKKPAPRRDSKQPALKSPPLQPPALKQLVLTPSALQQPAPSTPTHPPLTAPAPALKQSLLQPSPSLTPSPSLDRQALRKQALAAANQAHSASFLWRFYGDGRFPTPSSIQHLQKSPAQTRVWNASPSPTHFFSKKDGRDKKSIHDVCRLSVVLVYVLVNPDDSDWRSATVESLVSLASACFQGSAKWTKSPPGQALWKCLIGLAKMSPECFDDLYCKGNLMPSTEGQVWLSANRVLGSHWFFKTKPPAPAPTAVFDSSTQVSGSWSVSFFPSVGAALVISSSAGHFLQRRGVCSSDSRAPVDVTEGTKCSYSSYFTLSLPRLMSPRPSDLYDEMLESLTDVLSLLWSTKPVPKLWSTLPDRRTLELYVASLWLRVRAAPHIRFYIGHSVPVDTLLSDTLLQQLQDREMDFKLY